MSSDSVVDGRGAHHNITLPTKGSTRSKLQAAIPSPDGGELSKSPLPDTASHGSRRTHRCVRNDARLRSVLFVHSKNEPAVDDCELLTEVITEDISRPC